jgi:threonylcarbamoyladenosine tRNA methylthiotransferase MtaB
VFTYSERANTTAKKMANAVPLNIRRERSRQLQILSDKKRRAFYETQLQSDQHVLFEAEEEMGIMYGFTANYVKVKTPYNSELVNQIVPVKLDQIDRDGIVKVELIHALA